MSNTQLSQNSRKGFLTPKMKKFVNAASKKGYNVSQYNNRLVGSANLSIKDLQFIAERLDEDLQAEIFTVEKLMPFFEALFKLNYKSTGMEEVVSSEKNERQLTEKELIELEKRRKRLLKLSYELITWIGAVSSRELAPQSRQLLMRDVPLGLRAIIMEAY